MTRDELLREKEFIEFELSACGDIMPEWKREDYKRRLEEINELLAF